MRDLHALPRLRDGWTFLYAEHARVEQDDHALVLVDASGRVPLPAAALTVLMLGPGTTVSHAAVHALAACGASIVWCGEGGVRCYATGLGETRRSHNLLAQATAWADPAKHLDVVRRLYTMRFDEELDPALTLQQIRGMEGVRVRDTYARQARETGVTWTGRKYVRGKWNAADPINRALSAANACLYGLCHGGLVATGFSVGLGFIHTGKALAFVYDVADLYKCDVTIPVAFAAVRDHPKLDGLEGEVRRRCRDMFRSAKLLERLVPDVQRALGMGSKRAGPTDAESGADAGVEFDGETGEAIEAVADLWDPDEGAIEGGRSFADKGWTKDPDEDSGPESEDGTGEGEP